jgi:hypothetical protein
MGNFCNLNLEEQFNSMDKLLERIHSLLDLEPYIICILCIFHPSNTSLLHNLFGHMFFQLVQLSFVLDITDMFLKPLQLNINHKLVLSSIFLMNIAFSTVSIMRMILKLSNIVKYYTLMLSMMNL